TTLDGQTSLLLQTDVLSHKLFLFGVRCIVGVCQPLEKLLRVIARCENAMYESKVSYCRRIDVEDRDAFRLPERNQIQTVKPTNDADHVDVFFSVVRDAVVMG